MLTTNAYLLSWFIALLGAGGLLFIVFRMTNGWRPVALRVVLRTVAALWLLMPAVVEPGAPQESMAPALIVILFELTGGFQEALRVIEPMLILTAAVVPVVLAGHWAFNRWLLQRNKRNAVRQREMA